MTRRVLRGPWRAEPRIRQLARELRRDMTRPELLLWDVLRNRRLDGFRFRRQYPVGNYIVDFFCPAERLVIEVDGETHDEMRAAYDARRTRWLQERKHLRVLRVANTDVLQNLEGVYELIRQELRRVPPPNLPRSRRCSRGRGKGH